VTVLDSTTIIEKQAAPPRHRLTHAENPRQPGVALCGAKLTRRPRSAGAERCVVCLDMARRPFMAR
jgi:hypothetical protein